MILHITGQQISTAAFAIFGQMTAASDSLAAP